MPGGLSLLGSVSFAWLHEHGGLRFDEPFFMEPRCRLEREQAAARLVAERFPDEPVYCFEACLVQVEGRRRPVALVGGIQPNLILGAALGAELVFYGDKDADITPTPLAGIADLASLWQIDWPNTWPVDLFLRQVRQMRAELPPEYAVVPPFFWDTTGRATVHGILTTAQKLVGERVFLDVVDNRTFVRELFDWIADAYARLIRLFADAAGMPITGLHVGECSACMLGPDEFAELVLPPTNKLIGLLCSASDQPPLRTALSVGEARAPAGNGGRASHPTECRQDARWPGGEQDVRLPAGGQDVRSLGGAQYARPPGEAALSHAAAPPAAAARSEAGAAERGPARFGARLHSCGLSDHLLDAAAGLNNLACLNVGSGTSVSGIRERFGAIRIDLIPPPHLLTAAEPSAVDAWVRRVLEDNGGGPLEFQFHLDAGQPEANALQIARTLRAMGIACPREAVF